MPYPKRLIKVDLPIKRISAYARREKLIRHGHISTVRLQPPTWASGHLWRMGARRNPPPLWKP